MPDWLTSILLGVIEGITEFLPVSSTGHLLVPQQLGWLEKQTDLFNIAIQSGAVIAVLFNFTDRVKQLTLRWREPEARDYLAVSAGCSSTSLASSYRKMCCRWRWRCSSAVCCLS